MRRRRRDALSDSAVELVVLRVNAVRGDVAALLVVGADFGEPPVRPVRPVCAGCVEEGKGQSHLVMSISPSSSSFIPFPPYAVGP